MGKRVRLSCAVTVVCCVLVGSSVAASAAHPPIKPGQHFVGLVNGKNRHVVVHTACPGPSSGPTGPVAGGQVMSVVHVAKGHGNTGLFSHVYAWFVPITSGTTPTSLSFTTYNTKKSIPTSIKVACSGTGIVEFSSCPYLAPCAYGWTPSYVLVRFVNVAT